MGVFKKAALICLGICLAIVLLECGLRLAGFAILSWQECANIQSLKQKGALRIVCLGESTTQNQYPRFLEEILNQRNAGIRFSVIDKGLAGTTTTCILNNLKSFLDTYHPDIVVTMIGINDQADYISYEDSFSFRREALLIKSLKTYKLARLLWSRLVAKANLTRAVQFYNAGMENEDTKTEEERFARCLKVNPNDAGCYIRMGEVYGKQRNFSAAEKMFEKAVELDPGNPAYNIKLGWAYRKQDKFSQAESALKKGIALKPDVSLGYAELGAVYGKTGDFLEAEKILNKGIALNPHDSGCYNELGEVFVEQHRFYEAEKAFTRCLELDPHDIGCYRRLGWLYQTQGNYSQAEALFRKGTEINPADDNLCGVLAVFYGERGNMVLSDKYYHKVNKLREGTSNPEVVRNYHRIKEMLDVHKLKLVCVQYPMRSIAPLKEIFAKDSVDIFFVDNERIFKEAVQKEGYRTYFIDNFGGDFGHCTAIGNRLLAENIANVILKEVLKK